MASGIIGDSSLSLPEMVRVQQVFDSTALEDLEGAIHAELARAEIAALVQPGMRIALLVGSRGIARMKDIVKCLGDALLRLGAHPFIVPAMGSHGNATAEGQAEVLAGYGITGDSMGFPVVSSMAVDELGACPSGVCICVDSAARAADLVIPINRVKPHTDFTGEIESGLCKILTIGLGNREGCTRLHRRGFKTFHTLIPEAADYVIRHMNIGFGLAIIENAYDQPLLVRAVPAQRILAEEPELLRIARSRMPGILLKEIDVLVIEEIGKNISGSGMDPNITGRTARGNLEDFKGPLVQRILVLGLSEASHGNACGIGAADFLMASAYQGINLEATAINSITSGAPEGARIPILVKDEAEGIRAALLSCADVNPNAPRVVKIRNTLDLGEIWVSKALLAEVEANPKLAVMGGTGQR